MPAESIFMKGGNLRRLCEVKFRDGKTAIVEPYVIYTGENKRHLFLWYQLSSDPPEDAGWRSPEAAYVVSAKLLDQTFQPRPEYDPFDRKKYPVMHYSIPTADGRQRWMDAGPPRDKQEFSAG
jgi:hypothetical protein